MKNLKEYSMAAPPTSVIFFINMVTPYMSAIYNDLNGANEIDLKIISCSDQEKNRRWDGQFKSTVHTKILRGWQMRLGEARFAHLNTGIFRELNRADPEILVINGFYPSMLIGAVWALFNGRKLGLIIDGWRHTMPQTFLHRMIRPQIIKRCEFIIACGEKGRRYFLEEGVDPARVFIAPLVPAWDAPSDPPAFEARRFDLLWCGHLSDTPKNSRFFMELCVELSKRVSGLRVLIVGGGPMLSEILEVLGRASVEYNHLEYVESTKMASIFLQSKLLVLPSVWEAWGLVCNEAMQCGTPCIVSPFVGAADDLVNSNVEGFVLPLDLQTWCDHAFSILDDAELWRKLSGASLSGVGRRTRSQSVEVVRSAIHSAVQMD